MIRKVVANVSPSLTITQEGDDIFVFKSGPMEDKIKLGEEHLTKLPDGRTPVKVKLN